MFLGSCNDCPRQAVRRETASVASSSFDYLVWFDRLEKATKILALLLARTLIPPWLLCVDISPSIVISMSLNTSSTCRGTPAESACRRLYSEIGRAWHLYWSRFHGCPTGHAFSGFLSCCAFAWILFSSITCLERRLLSCNVDLVVFSR